MRDAVYPALAAAIDRGVPMICPCNGFQIAVQAGLLPGAEPGRWPTVAAAPSVALCRNRSARFRDVWTRVSVPSETRCVWTAGLPIDPDADLMPSAHGEGRFVTDPDTLARLEANGQIALRYHDADNFNGSMGAVAGICDPSGLLLGLMPHPERFTRWTQHPWWTRLAPDRMRDEPLGLRMFQRAVARVTGHEPIRAGGVAARA
jgi:phosphoribosylformylglycinamidine (FGAM) synthase-like amidotransferase family enzyme